MEGKAIARGTSKLIKHFSMIVPLLFTLNCFSNHKPPPEPIESPKSNTVQNSNDSMVEAQKLEEKDTTSLKGAVPIRAEGVKKFEPATEKKIENYVKELLKAGGVGIELPSQDAWMIKEIQERLKVPREGYWYIVAIYGPNQYGNFRLSIVARMRAGSF